MKKLFLISVTLFFMQETFAQQTIPLYNGPVPNSKAYTTEEWWEPQDDGDTIVHYISQPTLTIFLPDKSKANGTAVIICPRSEEHTSELQSPVHLVCRLLLEKKK